ncbi:MAG: hypothetical protein AVDCRST_MAG93-6631, partial [uncultured Chloroflexia bacterium]
AARNHLSPGSGRCAATACAGRPCRRDADHALGLAVPAWRMLAGHRRSYHAMVRAARLRPRRRG